MACIIEAAPARWPSISLAVGMLRPIKFGFVAAVLTATSAVAAPADADFFVDLDAAEVAKKAIKIRLADLVIGDKAYTYSSFVCFDGKNFKVPSAAEPVEKSSSQYVSLILIKRMPGNKVALELKSGNVRKLASVVYLWMRKDCSVFDLILRKTGFFIVGTVNGKVALSALLTKSTIKRDALPKITEKAPATPKIRSLDPRFPNMDHTQVFYQVAKRSGYKISGRWVYRESKAKIDDTLTVTAINGAIDPSTKRVSSSKSIYIRCSEGETSFVVGYDTYLSAGSSNLLRVEYRIDHDNAVNTRWSISTSNKHSGLWGKRSIPFVQKLIKRKVFYIRVTEQGGERHEAYFDLRGLGRVLNRVGFACGWDSLAMKRSDLLRVQVILKAKGYYGATPDGAWGKKSRAALISFQAAQGLTKTGTLNKETLQKMGWKAQQKPK